MLKVRKWMFFVAQVSKVLLFMRKIVDLISGHKSFNIFFLIIALFHFSKADKNVKKSLEDKAY